MSSPEAIGEINYWADLLIKFEGSPESKDVIQKIPSHLLTQVLDVVSKHFVSLVDPDHQDEEIKTKYTDDPKYGIDSIKSEPLEEDAIKLGSAVGGVRQTTPYVRGKDMEEHHASYQGVSEENLEILNSYKRDTGSANQTDILPHLFKRQQFYKGIENDLDKTIAVAVEGFSQAYLMTRVRKRASGSLFRKTAGLENTETELLPRDLTRQGVIERKVENFNPFKGKFTFRTTYGAPPTASLSQSSAEYIAQLDLGTPLYGSDYILYNTTTGSLSSGSLLSANVEFKRNDGIIISNFATTESLFQLKFKQPTTLTYTSKWEQNITSQSTADVEIDVTYTYKTYKPSVTNGNFNSLFPTKKTVLKNGNIFIT